MGKPKNKSKRDYQNQLAKIAKVQYIITWVTALDILALMVLGLIHISKNVQSLPYVSTEPLGLMQAVVMTIMIFIVPFGLSSLEKFEKLIKELEKKIREDERRFPHDILDPNRNKPPNN